MSVTPARLSGVLVGSLVALLALVGCTGTDPASDPAASGVSLLPAAEGTTTYPLTLSTAYGETVLEERPERIAVIGGLGDQESVIGLGIVPVVGSDDFAYSWETGTTFDDVTTFVDPWADTFAFEEVLAADPDLIVASTYGNLESDFARLATIAPVLAVETVGDYEWDWRELTLAVGEATDLAASAAKEIAITEQSITDAAASHPEYDGRTIGIIINRGQEVGIEFVNTDDSTAAELLEQLGFAAHPQHEQLSALDGGDVALENIGLIDADALLVAQHGGDGTAQEAAAWLDASPLFQKLGAVQAGKVSSIDLGDDSEVRDLAWSLAYPNVLSLRWTVDAFQTAFEGLFD